MNSGSTGGVSKKLEEPGKNSRLNIKKKLQPLTSLPKCET